MRDSRARLASGPAESLCSREEVLMRQITRRRALITEVERGIEYYRRHLP